MILSLGLDSLPGDRVEVTVQMAIPIKLSGAGGRGSGGSEGQEMPTQLATARADTVPEALQMINREVSRQITLLQNRLIIFGEDTARKGLSPFMSLFTRYREFRRTMQIIVTKGKAKDAMRLKIPSEANPADYLSDIILASHRLGETDVIDINDFLSQMESRGAAPVATYISSTGKASEKKVRIDGLAVFRKDRMIGRLRPKEVMGQLILTRRFGTAFMSMPDPIAKHGRIVLQITSARPRFQARLRDGRTALRVWVKAEADLVYAGIGYDYTVKAHEKRMEHAVAKVLRGRLISNIRKAQTEFHADSIGLGNCFRSILPTWNQWEAFDWNRRFPSTPVEMEVEVYIRRFGLQRESPVPVS